MDYRLVSYYVKKARTILGDPEVAGDTTRWATEDLVDFLNDGVELVASKYSLMKESKLVEPTAFTPDYDYTDFAYEITRLEYNTVNSLELISRRELDRLKGKSWLVEVGTPTHAVFDSSDVGNFRLYPMPDDKQYTTSQLDVGSVSVIGEVTSVLTPTGEVPLASLVSATPPTAIVNLVGSYGIYTLVKASLTIPHTLRLFYKAKKPIYALADNVEVDSRLVRPLVDYIVAEALALGIDSENRDLSGKYRRKFDIRIIELNKTTINSGGDGYRSVAYNNGFNLDTDPRGST